ncbi:MAG: nucleotide sugar dehydrogenase, partial [Candidatus Bathyarchaeia archaeon]
MEGSKPINRDSLSTFEGRSRYTVCVVGCGRMGLPHACLFASAGFRVIGVDKDPRVIESLSKGESPFEEPGLDGLVSKHVREGRLTVTKDCTEAASRSDIIVLIVPTTVDRELKPDYSHLKEACLEVGGGMRLGTLLIVASTVGPGVTETMIRDTLEKASGLKAGRDFGLAFSPIRATAGRTLYDIEHYARVVGGINHSSLESACTFLETIVKAGTLPVSSIKVAEVVKLFQNVHRDVNLALANEFALLCEKLGVDYLEAREAAVTDPYCHLLVPGLVSGHIPKDPYLLIKEAEEHEADLRVVKVARSVNESVVKHALQLLEEALEECDKKLVGAKVAVLGVSYKANVKEFKGSKAIEVIRMLMKRGTKLRVYDPYFTSKDLSD